MNQLQTYRIFFSFLSILSGAFICLIFVAFDVTQLGIQFNWKNIIEVFKAQYIYSFTILFFPLLFFALNQLIFKVLENNKKLANQKQFSNNLLSNINQSIAVLDQDLKITFSNKLFQNNFDNRFIENIYLNDSILESLKAREEIYFKEIAYTENGIEKFYEINFLEFEEISCCEPTRYILTILDISQRKKNLKMIQEKDAILKSSAHLTSLGEMAAGMAHEINNPLAIISANNYILKKLISKEEINIDRFLKVTQENDKTIDRISLIIKSLRSLARKADSEEFISMPLNESISEALVLAKIKVNNTYIKFDTEFNMIEDEIVDIRKIQFAQVIVNIINNAIDAVKNQVNDKDESQGWVKLSLEQDQMNIFIRITDSGNGIPSEIENKIFEPLFTTKEVGQGTGLGLSLSRRIIEEHGGELYIDKICKNTQFVIKVPKSRYAKSA